MLGKREWLAVAVTSPRTGVAPGRQTAVAAAFVGAAVHDKCLFFREALPQLWAEMGGMPSVYLNCGRKSDAGDAMEERL